ncbi:MAG: hypothetical protein ACFFD2_00750 [Promethearchaeota archaeon]
MNILNDIMINLIILGFAEDSYNQILAIANFLCFGAVCLCVVAIFIIITVGQFIGKYKSIALISLFILICLFTIHFILLDLTGIPLLVPPVKTIYFTEFMHILQYIASFAVLILGVIIFTMAALSRLDKGYQHYLISGVISLIILLLIHYYLFESFGIQLIFPPTLW